MTIDQQSRRLRAVGLTGGLGRIGRLLSAGRAESAVMPAVMIVSSRHRLWQRYGPDGVFAIERAVGELIEAMDARGLSGTLVYADDSPLLGRFGVLPADTGRADQVARVVRELAARMAWTEESVGHVLILGDDGIVPFDRPTNPAPDDESALRSDHIYAADADEPLMPVRAVGRMPDRGLSLLVASIREAAAAHRQIAAGRPLPLTDEAFGYSASVWKRAARGVYAAVGDPAALRLCPPLTHVEAPRPGADGPRYRYYNLHGMVDSPAWFGQRDPAFRADYDRFPVALRPEDVQAAPGNLVFSAACYGAHIEGRAVHDSIALTHLAGGCRAFVGATGVAYGGLDGGLVAADLLAYRFWEALRSGAAVGQALAHAKWSLVSETLARQGYVDAEDEKAVHNFVLYGDPSLVYQAPSTWAEDAAAVGRARGAAGWAGPADWVGTTPARPRAIDVVDPVQSSPAALGQLVAQVRGAVARLLPEFGAGEVGVSTQPAPRRVHAKSGLVAGDASQGPMIVTLKKSLRTGDGTACREVVCVTVDARGAIRKLTVSRG
ncbi:MAG: hypothetical protein KDH92_15455 [Chloroflexi bacterium]|nr:hypothetical protein [Chloroflexota bacterium]